MQCCVCFCFCALADFDKHETFALKSDVNLRARDSQGWSVLHHLVSPIDFGTYDSVAMLKILYDLGGDVLLKMQDKAGLTAVDYSLIKGAPRLSRALQRLLGIDEDKWVRASPRRRWSLQNRPVQIAVLDTHNKKKNIRAAGSTVAMRDLSM